MNQCQHDYEAINGESVCILCLASKPPEPTLKPFCCDNPDIHPQLFLEVCVNCGQGVEYPHYVSDFDIVRYLFNKKNAIYKRMKYFRQKLAYVTVCSLCRDKDLNQVVKELEQQKILDFTQILVHLKKKKLRKYTKHVYEIFYMLNKRKVIDMTRHQVLKLEYLFVRFEKELRKQKVKYLNNYNEIIFVLMQKLEIEGSQYILKPDSFTRNEHIYKKILSNL